MSNKTLDINDTLLDYIIKTGVNEPDLKKRLRDETKTLEMGKMQIAPEQGAFMGFIANLVGAKSYLEIGVFTGYSMLSVVGAMGKDSSAVGCDLSKEWTDIAKRYWLEAGIQDQVNLYIDKAENSLKKLDMNSFDLAFIDADKSNYDLYYEECLRLLKPNGLLMIDNIFWGGDVANKTIVDADTTAIRALNEKIMQDKRVQASMLTIGDGLMLVRKL
ncbi:MAG: Putative O-methyltransferase/MSMEI_4947 [uncultured Sulfurimonas sp.]|nr:MAG: Putative O-methyltransferase/MSMEI_4947 [uncultured Sulfurimonas sp.]CAI6151654.1 MAG: Putative O-methyltransferase/MSMEI_4947 [uncultured Sulfurimonas sp.]